MPGFYASGEYDLAGFIVGAVDRARIVNGATLEPGDALIGLPSTGLHTNGYSLARRIVFEALKLKIDSVLPELGTTVADALLAVHRSYLRPVEPLLAEPGLVKGLAHITGGGITDNLPRIFPAGVGARIDRRAWEVPALFRFLGEAGQVPVGDMYRSFNMGIGLIVACRSGDAARVMTMLEGQGEAPCVIGELVRGERSVRYVI
jgi:phosphoribosylformylglycinamidine cyclo-ligase